MLFVLFVIVKTRKFQMPKQIDASKKKKQLTCTAITSTHLKHFEKIYIPFFFLSHRHQPWLSQKWKKEKEKKKKQQRNNKNGLSLSE